MTHNTDELLEFPEGYSARQYVEDLATEHTSLNALAAALADATGLSQDSERKALTRLRAGKPGGGEVLSRLLLHFGLPTDVKRWIKWMGQYHSRFSDMPTHLCRDYLALWNRPAVTGRSEARIWLYLGRASVSLRRRDHDAVREFLSSTQRDLARANQAAASVEYALVDAFFASTEGDLERERVRLEEAGARLDSTELDEEERACYRARWVDQLAYREYREHSGSQLILEHNLAQYEALVTEASYPFADFRREYGRAYCLWRLHDVASALMAIRAASEHAADGGFVGLRAQSLKLEGRITEVSSPQAARGLRRRAEGLARSLDDLELLYRAGVSEHPQG